MEIKTYVAGPFMTNTYLIINDKKGITVVELKEKGNCSVRNWSWKIYRWYKKNQHNSYFAYPLSYWSYCISSFIWCSYLYE